MNPSHREPTHPGEMLLEEFLRPLGITQMAAAQKMRIPLNRLNEIIHAKRGVTADTAIRLAKLLGTSPEFWMNLQSSWDIYAAAKHLHVSISSVTTVAAIQSEEATAAVRMKWNWSMFSFSGTISTQTDTGENVDAEFDTPQPLVA